jgi:monothiol glutaredoxin
LSGYDLVRSGYGGGGSGSAVAAAAWLLLAILLWLNNGLRYIYRRSELAWPNRPIGAGQRGLRPEHALPKKEAKMSIEQFIDNEVKSNDVVLFMKGTPQFPQCGFSGQVVQILDHVGVGYKGLNVLESADLRNGIKTYSNWPTIPQLYVKGEFVGGCDIIREMFQAGELQKLLADKGVAVSTAASA